MAPKRAPRETKATASAAAAKPASAKPRGRPAGVKKEVAEKKPTATKKATESKKPEAKANTSKKRKAEADVEEAVPAKKLKRAVETKTATKVTTKKTATKKTAVKEKKVTKAKKADKVAPAPKAPKREKTPKPAPAPKPKVVINAAPTTRLDVFAFGSNSNAELGMGDTFKKAECPRPKFNTVLSNAGVVQISAGGMHGIALTHDNKVLTWGVNDQGALGRDTTWEGGLVDMDKAQESDSDDDEEIEVNPKEATPTEIDLSGVKPGTVFTQVVAADSASFALTDDGFVYGWGTFRVSFP